MHHFGHTQNVTGKSSYTLGQTPTHSDTHLDMYHSTQSGIEKPQRDLEDIWPPHNPRNLNVCPQNAITIEKPCLVSN